MKDTYTVPLDLSYSEYVRFTLYLLPRMRLIRRLFVFLTCIGLLSGLLGIVASEKSTPVTALSILQCIGPPSAFVLFSLVFVPLGSLFIVKFKPDLIRGITYRFTHWGMEMTTLKREISVPWRNFLRLKETKNFFLLYAGEGKVNQCHVVQKRMFAGSEEAEDFKAFVEANMPL